MGTSLADCLASPPFQIGTLVEDAEPHITTHKATGVGPWIDSGWMSAEFYDAPTDQVVTVGHRAVFGKLTDDVAVEFISVDRSGPVPAAWDLKAGGPTAHLGYWVDDPGTAAAELIAAGARILLARAGSAEMVEAVRSGDPSALPGRIDMCYLDNGSGLLVELVPSWIWGGRLRTGFGDGVVDVMAPPPANFRTTSPLD